MKKFSKFTKRLIYMLTIFAIVICTCNFCITGSNIKKHSNDVKTIDKFYINGVEQETSDKLVQFNKDKPTIVMFKITKDMTGKCLEFFTSHTSLDLFVGGEKIYTLKSGDFFNHTAGTACNMVDIPSNSAGKYVRIEFYNCYGNSYKTNFKPKFIYGTQIDIIKYLVKTTIFSNIMSILLLIAGVLAFVFGLIFSTYLKNATDIVYLGLLELFIAIWSLTESSLVRIIVGNPSALNTVSYYSLFIAPLFYLMYVRNNTYGKNVSKGYISYLLLLHCSYIVVVTLLQVFNIRDFIFSLKVYHFILIIEILTILFFTIFRYKFNKKDDEKFNAFLALFLIGVVFDIIFWDFSYKYNMLLTHIGLFIYINSIVYSFLKLAIDELRTNMNTEELKQIAYKDQLTEINNRNAFISRINNLDISKVIIISFDLNNLKYYNDNFGHDRGDLLLKSMALTLKEVFGDNAYRIGGDEFEVILSGTSVDEVWTLLSIFETKEGMFNKENKGVILQSAYGVGFYQEGFTINDIIKMADENMYTHKKFLKSKGVNILR